MIPATIGTSMPDPPAVVAEPQEVRVVEEKLRHHRVRSGVDLGLEVLEVTRAVQALRVPLGEAGDGGEEVVATSDVLDHFARVLETALALFPRSTRRRIAAKGEHVVHVDVPELVEDLADLVGGVADAGQVGHDVELRLLTDAGAQVERLLARAHRRRRR